MRLVIQGHVWLGSEAQTGLSEVRILQSYSSCPGTPECTIHHTGHLESHLGPIPGDEMNTVWAELDGYTFDPPSYSWRHCAGAESQTLSFVASPDASSQ
jgi:hypothetical protein